MLIFVNCLLWWFLRKSHFFLVIDTCAPLVGVVSYFLDCWFVMSVQMRRQLVRLANLSNVMALRMLSTNVAKRFPTFHHLVQVSLSQYLSIPPSAFVSESLNDALYRQY